MIATFNLVIALLIWTLVVFIGVSHWHERGFSNRTALLGVVVFCLSTVTLFSAVVTPLGLNEYVEAFRFGSAVFRSIALVLLLSYLWNRWSEG